MKQNNFNPGAESTEDSQERNKHNLEQWLPIWMQHYRMNAHAVNQDFDKEDRNCYKVPIPDRVTEENSAIVCGSGPSLDLIYPYLKDWKGFLVCGPTNVSGPLKYERPPDYILYVDASPECWMHTRNMPLPKDSYHIVPPQIHPQVVSWYPNTRYWYRSHVQIGLKIENVPFNEFTDAMWCPPINTYMIQAGCTANQEVIFLNIFNQLRGMNIKNVFLCGLDFGYPNTLYRKTRATIYGYNDQTKQFTDLPQHKGARTRAHFMKSEYGIDTDRSMIGYKRSLYAFWYMTGQVEFQCEECNAAWVKPELVDGVKTCPGCKHKKLIRRPNPMRLFNLSQGILEEIPRPYGDTIPLEDQIKQVFYTDGKDVKRYSDNLILKRYSDYVDRNKYDMLIEGEEDEKTQTDPN